MKDNPVAENESQNAEQNSSLASGAETTVTYTSSTKRIAKNTLMLYFRQILIMLVSLYTVRVVLATLGAEDYGIYNVVAGVVVMFSFVNSAMASGTQRFLNFYLGRNDAERTNQVYSASLVIHSLIALLFVAVAESAGLWFVGRKLNIPADRHDAAMIVYQLTILTTVFSILRVSYNATVIAHERMSFFALLSIVEAALKLLVVFLLRAAQFDKLVFYAFLLAAVALVVTLVYKLYCNKVFVIAHYKRVRDFDFVREQLSFSGWSLFGAVANVANSQGTNVVLNVFTNVTVNASMGIANQVNTAVYSFVSNFQTAFNPQIVKSYAAGEREEFQRLLVRTAKFSFFLLWLIVLPLYVNVEFILALWLEVVPEYSVQFLQLILILSLVESVNGPLFMAIQATGRIKLYQICIGIINLLNLPLTIMAFCLGASPMWILYIRILLNVFALIFRIGLCGRMTGLSVVTFLKNAVAKPFLIAAFSFAIVALVGTSIRVRWMHFAATCAVGFATTSAFVFCFGMNSSERNAVVERMKRRFG